MSYIYNNNKNSVICNILIFLYVVKREPGDDYYTQLRCYNNWVSTNK